MIFFDTLLQKLNGFFKVGGVRFVEGGETVAVDVEDGDDLIVLEDGHHDFAAGSGRAGDMAGKLFYIGHHERMPFFPCGAAHASPVRDARAGERPLERP